MSTVAYAWAPITKVEDQGDGTIMVYGPAADAGPDRDKQRCNQEWLDQALPEWMASGANVREQHDGLRAVGVGVGLTRASDGTHQLAAHVVDPVAVLKVHSKVLKGFSIRIKDPHIDFGKADAPNGEIVGGTIPEISLVDRPANPRTYFTMVKADEGGELTLVDGAEVVELGDDMRAHEVDEDEVKSETGLMPMYRTDLVKFVSSASRKRMASSGVAMPNGDFPIPDEGHLHSAIGHLGNYTGDKAAAKAHIISRARALGLTNLLPDEWGVSKAEQILAEVRTLVPDVTKADDGSDVATAQQAIALVAKLIASEAASMGGGDFDEDSDIACLLDAVRALKYFIACEEKEMEPAPDLSAQVADSMNMDGDVYMKTEAPAASDVTKVDNAGIADIVKAAVAEATTPLKDELALVKADVAKALAMPEPGGPVAMRTASQTAAARGADAASLRAQAAELLAKADAARREDPTLSLGYRQRAAELMDKADA